jgi:hypothetical protein
MMMEYSRRPVVPQFLLDDLLEQPDVMFLQPFVEELRGHLDGQHMVIQLQGLDRFEPGLETLLADIVPDDIQAPPPYLLVVFLHGWVGALLVWSVKAPSSGLIAQFALWMRRSEGVANMDTKK